MHTDHQDVIALYDAHLRLVAGEPLDDLGPHLAEALRTRRPVSVDEVDARRAHAVRITPLTGPSGTIEHLVVARRDVIADREAEHRASQLGGITMHLAASLSDQEIGRAVICPIHSALGATASVAYLIDEDGLARLVASRGLSPARAARLEVLGPDSSLPLAEAIRRGVPVWGEDHASGLSAFPELATTGFPASDLQAFAAIPARVDGRTLGGVAFSFAEPRRFDAPMREFLLAVATQYAIAAERSRLFRIERRARDRLELLVDASRAFSAARLDLGAVLDTVCREVARRIRDSCVLHLIEADGAMSVAALHHVDPEAAASVRATLVCRPVRVGDPSAPGRVAATGEAVFIPSNASVGIEEMPPEHRAHLERYPVDSLVIVPVRSGDRVIGTLTVSRGGPPALGREDLALLQELGDRAALSIENARLYQEAAEARERAEAANRAKDHFLALLGHELRNPLAPILAAARLLRERPGDDIAREVIERQSRHMVRLVDDLLDVSRITSRKLTLRTAPVEIADVVGRAVEVARPLLDHHGVRLVVGVPTDGCRVDGDADRLAQVFANLLTNAAQYGAAGGGVVEISASVSLDPDPELGDRHGVVVEVRDDGEGIAPELLPRLFTPFTQGSPGTGTRAGLGLGLAIVRNLVELHGGRVGARSEGPGLGATFVVRLPATAQPRETPSSSARARSAPRRDVLVVDDNRDAADALSTLLALDGHRVRVAYDAASALALARERAPEVALLDIGLPDLDGWELGRRFLELPRPPRVYALTGYGQPSDAERSRAAGFARHLVKPLDPDQLDSLLAELR